MVGKTKDEPLKWILVKKPEANSVRHDVIKILKNEFCLSDDDCKHELQNIIGSNVSHEVETAEASTSPINASPLADPPELPPTESTSLWGTVSANYSCNKVDGYLNCLKNENVILMPDFFLMYPDGARSTFTIFQILDTIFAKGVSNNVSDENEHSVRKKRKIWL